MNVICPLSKSLNNSKIEEIKVSQLVKLYSNLLKVDISSEFDGLEKIEFFHCPESDLKFFHPSITGSEFLYEKLQEIDWYYMDEKDEFDYAKRYINEYDSVLEIGCGKGAFAKKIAPKNYTGLEFSQKAQAAAHRNGIMVINESIEAHAIIKSSSYSIVCAFQVLEHISEIYEFIEASLKCLKPGGLLIYSVPSAESFFSSVKNLTLNLPPHHVSWWSDKSLNHIAKIFNLKVIDINHEKLSDVHKVRYASSIILKSIEKILSYQSNNLLIDLSLIYNIMSKISLLGGTVLAQKFCNPNSLPDGHTVTVVYQKP
ncbi:MAG: class I SAM-dependent methyltransferase [Scytonematopsis contorta HA4267-MV1]|jgi:SAM-dependent methyltransferase|nr:class I SAM-dependent methyltransferase [Scytonematopsis contorta HA4267-MV1]